MATITWTDLIVVSALPAATLLWLIWLARDARRMNRRHRYERKGNQDE